jgi:hypothetical protein
MKSRLGTDGLVLVGARLASPLVSARAKNGSGEASLAPTRIRFAT